MRTPAVLEWIKRHSADGCPNEGSSCAVCGLFLTHCQVLGGFGSGENAMPVLARHRGKVGAVFEGRDQHDVFEFLEQFVERARRAEIGAGRYAMWGHVQGIKGCLCK